MGNNNVGFYRVTVNNKISYPIYCGLSGYSSITVATVSTPPTIQPGQTVSVSTTIQNPTY